MDDGATEKGGEVDSGPLPNRRRFGVVFLSASSLQQKTSIGTAYARGEEVDSGPLPNRGRFGVVFLSASSLQQKTL